MGTSNISQDRIPVSCPTMPDMGEIATAIKENLYSGEIRLGDTQAQFEGALQRYLGCEHAVAVSSSTSGLILALAAMEFPEGGEVILPSFTFGSTVQAIHWNRLTPVFVDCLPGTLTIDPAEVVRAFTRETVAFVPVTVFGLPPDMDELDHISRAHGIPAIFDSSQGLGSLFDGKPIGGFGRCEIFSLNSEMVVTAGEGGVVVTNDSDLDERVRAMRQSDEMRGEPDIVPKGISSRMGDFHASIGLLSLRQADALINSRLRLINKYRARLEGIPGCAFQQMAPNRKSNGTYFTIFVTQEARRNRDQVLEGLNKADIQGRQMLYPPAHAHRAFRRRPGRAVGELRNTWTAASSSLGLPLYSHMTDETFDRVCEAVEFLLAG